MPKVGTQLLLNPRDRDRVRALALVRGQLQAEILRQLVEHALSVYETVSARELQDMRDQLERLGQGGHGEAPAVKALLESKIPVAALRHASRFPVPL